MFRVYLSKPYNLTDDIVLNREQLPFEQARVEVLFGPEAIVHEKCWGIGQHSLTTAGCFQTASIAGAILLH